MITRKIQCLLNITKRLLFFKPKRSFVLGFSVGFLTVYAFFALTVSDYQPSRIAAIFTKPQLLPNPFFWSREHVDFVAGSGIRVNASLGRDLRQRVRILCWILTTGRYHETKARAVKDTWGRHCNYLVFMSDEGDASLPAIHLPVRKEYAHLWGKTKAALAYLHDFHIDDADFFMKADDDTFVIVENLRHALSDYPPEEARFWGRRVKRGGAQMIGGAGYVMSRGALQAFVGRGLRDPRSPCDVVHTLGSEDLLVGKCMCSLGVPFTDSRDLSSMEIFHQFPPRHIGNTYIWDNFYPTHFANVCCSPLSVSFHYIKPSRSWGVYPLTRAYLYEVYSLVYGTHVWGITDIFT